MAKQKSKSDKIVRCFEVSEPTLHPKGHTIYKIVQKLIPVDSPEKQIQQVIVWRRYNDIKKLYQAMLKLHNALHRKEEFPPFAAAKLFGRFDKEVIIERQRCAQDLLNFIAQRSYFVKSKAFQEFFQGGECSTVADASDILKPVRVGEDSVDLLGREEDNDKDSLTTTSTTTGGNWEVTDMGDDPPTEHMLEQEFNETDASLGGVWQFRQAADAISLGGLEEDDDDENTDCTDDSTLSTPLPASDAAFFDPFHALPAETQASTLKTSQSGSNEWLLSTMEICGVKPGEEGTPTSSGTPDASVILDAGDLGTKQVPDLPQVPTEHTDSPTSFYLEAPAEEVEASHQFVNKLYQQTRTRGNDITTDSNVIRSGPTGVEYGKGDLEFDPLRSVNGSSTLGPTSDQAEKKTSLTVPDKPLPKNLSLLNLDVQDKGDYIFQAANQISLGQQCEASGNYHMAFNYIRNGVGILLTGVQLDENAARREVVRRKTAKYLQRAEKLHKKYLEGQGNQNLADRWDKGQVSPTKLLDPQAACIEGPLSELKNYKVIGVIDGVMLVIDSTTDNTYVMKVIRKSSNSNSSKRRNIVPTYCPCMVKLHRFYETKYSIILVLQHAPGGKLWKYINQYLQNSTSQSEVNEMYLENNQGDLKYAGRAVHCKTDQSDAVDRLNLPQNKTSDLHANQGNNEVEISSDKVAPKVAYKADSDCIYSSANGSDNDDNNDISTHDGNVNRNCNVQTKDVSSSNLTELPDQAVTGTSVVSSSDINALQDQTSANPSLDTGEPLLLGHSPSQFQDLLKSTSSKPAIEAFSVNSLDSDSEPISRFESVTSDHIEVIQEVSENASPTSSPNKEGQVPKTNGNQGEHVFSDNSSPNTVESCARRSTCQNGTPGTSFLSETDRMLEEVDRELAESDRAFHNLLDSSSGVVHSHSTPSSNKQQVPTGGKETSIYDYRRSPDLSSSAGSDDLEVSDVEGLHDADKEVEDIHTGISIEDGGVNSNTRTVNNEGGLVRNSDSVFRQMSQERSLETDNKPRNRSASGMSSVFDNLDMVSEEKRAAITLPENSIRQWAAQVVTALEHLHQVGIVCRDLSPDNLLLGESGNVLLTYFCQWAQVDREVTQYSLDHFYAAPEVLGKGKHSPASDWWSLGVLLFELFTGKKLSYVYPFSINSHTQLEIPGDLSTEAQSVLTELLKYNPSERLGAGGGGVEEIKAHPFFKDIDWDSVANSS